MKQQVAVITGAGGALAKVVTEKFKENHWQLALIVHKDQERQDLERSHPEALVTQADLSVDDGATNAVKEILSRFGQIDALLNIAGGYAATSALETSSDDLKKQLEINLWTVFNTTRAALPSMVERGYGFILAVGASAAVNGGAKAGPYAASKAAMIAYLKSVQLEVGPKGVSTAVVYPMGAIDTPSNRKNMPGADPKKFIDPRELAETILHLATRSAAGQIHEVMVYPHPPSS
jgi:NAD(P)-dependent dehydrogenase (short-subunit alcohol dehydrogenase family)